MYKSFFLFLTCICLSISFSFGQIRTVTLTGIVKDSLVKTALPYVNVVLKTFKDSNFVMGVLSNEEGRFSLSGIAPGNYYLELSFLNYKTKQHSVYIGNLSEFLNLPSIDLVENTKSLIEVEINAKKDEVSGKMDKKIYSVEGNVSQSGGSVLQTIQNLPGVTVQDGKVQLRGK